MTDFEDRSRGLGGQVGSEIEVERDVVIVESAEPRNPFAVLPLLLGVLFLLANVVIFLRVPTVFTVKNVNGSISLLLILASLVTCLVLIIYGLAARRTHAAGAADGRSSFLRSVGVPLVLGLLAPLLTLWSLQVNKTASERANQSLRPCIEVYEKAQSIAKDNPRFRMPATDRDEVRCTVNTVLGR
jgi:hypothetical protein